MAAPRPTSPGWPELAVALTTYLVLILALALWLSLPDEQAALRGIARMAINGVAGTLAFLAACALRIRHLAAFGFRPLAARWLAIAAGCAAVAADLSVGIEHVYFSFITEPITQADFQAAAQAGPMSLLVLVFAGAILTPIGKELVFRGVVTNALNRHGGWAGVVGSAAIFAICHGLSVVLLNAFLVGVLTASLLRKAGSLWPAVVVHVVFNGIWWWIYSWAPSNRHGRARRPRGRALSAPRAHRYLAQAARERLRTCMTGGAVADRATWAASATGQTRWWNSAASWSLMKRVRPAYKCRSPAARCCVT